VSAVDAPPGVAFSGRASGELEARRRSRRIAQWVFWYVMAAGAATLAVAGRRLHVPMIELLLVAPLVFMSVAAVGYLVRRARIRVTADGVYWGWSWLGVTLRRDRLQSVIAYADAVALEPKRGSTWFLARRDWEGFEAAAPALRAAGFPVTHARGAMPWRARLQSYGIFLDALLIADALAATFALLVVAAL
jgi:hypothetical protein